MITIKFSGGLGNQMFQYALYLKYQSLGRKVNADLSSYANDKAGRVFELDIFGVKADEIVKADNSGKGLYGFIRKIRGDFGFYKDVIDDFQPEILKFANKTVSGYWQNEKYFSDIRGIIQKAFTFEADKLSEKTKEMAEHMSVETSVSIHVRRGDYLNAENNDSYGGICTLKYYKDAISHIRQKVKAPEFYIFSDDPEWCRENIWEEGMTIIDFNTGNQSYQDMYLMSRCKHHIIANSSFSWWGAWLGSQDGITIGPVRWFNDHERVETVCESWLKIRG